MEASADTRSIINDSIARLRDHLRRIHRDRIPGMDACTFNMLHALLGYKHFSPSATSIRFQFPAHNGGRQDRRVVADLIHTQ